MTLNGEMTLILHYFTESTRLLIVSTTQSRDIITIPLKITYYLSHSYSI